MLQYARHARGFIFAVTFAALAVTLRRLTIEVAPPRSLDVFLLGVALTTYVFSWPPALALFLASLYIAREDFTLPLWPPAGANLPNLVAPAVYCLSAAAIMFGVARLRKAISFWRGKADELHASQEALKESEALMRSVVDGAMDGIVTCDERGIIRSFNSAAERLFGYAAYEVIGRNITILMPPAMRERHDADMRRYLEAHGRPLSAAGREVVILRKDGATLPAELAISEAVVGERHVFAGILRDISQRKQAEDAIREANATLSAVIETSPLAICVTDLEGRVKSWNKAAESIFGWSESEIAGKRFPIVPDEEWDDFMSAVEEVTRGETYSGTHRRRRTRSGGAVDIAIWNAPLRSRSGEITGILSVIADVSDQLRLEQQLREAVKMEAIGRLAGGVAHDFNNILTVIKGYAEMLAESVSADEALSADVAEILKATDHAGALTNQLLLFSRHRPGNPEPIDLNEVVLRLQKMLRRVIGEDVELQTITAPNLSYVRADPGKVEQVLLNLAVNARDAMPDGGKLTIETAEVDLDSTYAGMHMGVAPGRYVMLAVSDTGIGMDAETHSRLFEPFFTTKEKGKGTGLGLSTVYGIVKQCNGEIWVYSEPNEGTTFKIYFPVVEGDAAPLPIRKETEPAAGGIETVLLAEDDDGVRKLVRSVLSAQGYRVLEAAGPEQALRICEDYTGAIHLLLTDVVMPVMSGRELAERVVAQRGGMRVLYMSGYTGSVVVHHGVAAGDSSSFIQKPFTPDELARKIRQVLDGEV